MYNTYIYHKAHTECLLCTNFDAKHGMIIVLFILYYSYFVDEKLRLRKATWFARSRVNWDLNSGLLYQKVELIMY